MNIKYEVHAAADIFPKLTAKQFNELVADIKQTGRLLEPIELLDGKILDGRHRFEACRKAGVTPTFLDLPADTNPWRYAVSKNIRRRHLKPGQRIALVKRALAKEIQAAKAADRERQRQGKKAEPEFNGTKVQTADEVVAERADVSKAAVKKFNVVEKRSPKLAKKVAEGKTSVGKAHAKVKKAGKPKKSPTKKSPEEILADVQEDANRQYRAKGLPVPGEEADGDPSEPERTTAPTQRVRSWLSAAKRFTSETDVLVKQADDAELTDEETATVEDGARLLTDAMEQLNELLAGVAS